MSRAASIRMLNSNNYIKDILKKGSLEAAPLLLGCILSRETPEGELAVRIVETEAYHQDDPASHSYRGLTMRTAPMFKEGGYIYVYFTYGMHYCVNMVVGQKGVGEAVLIRAAEPVKGVEIMKAHRGVENIHRLTNGPAKLTQALGIISTELSGERLGPKSLQLKPPQEPINPKDIVASPRIGIKQAVDNPWRFYIKDSPFVSK
jgi:DNA-3-methyladenine glycosylase